VEALHRRETRNPPQLKVRRSEQAQRRDAAERNTYPRQTRVLGEGFRGGRSQRDKFDATRDTVTASFCRPSAAYRPPRRHLISPVVRITTGVPGADGMSGS
jgi:hypothetical protein